MNNQKNIYICKKINDMIISKKFLRQIYTWNLRRKNKNHDFSILSSNCVGAMVTHDLGIRLNSPTVNLFMYPSDFISFLENIETNLSASIEDITGDSPYPIGLLNNSIPIHFLHYVSFNDAVNCWKRRAERVNLNNLYIVLVERDGCTFNDLKRFDALPYSHKVILSHKQYKNIQSARLIAGYEEQNEVGLITEYNGSWGKRHYDRFNWLQFLNSN
ncbi:DUF1919 domain-containing protein [Bacteroides neonati]|uniref:DUF1919 domain-containing protein n=1 Tax=Bacteroides neonati TaxID=1347393 RepID=UPI0009DE1362|nr:DUF1919 domain-containing protein [Bacteroides neonati]